METHLRKHATTAIAKTVACPAPTRVLVVVAAVVSKIIHLRNHLTPPDPIFNSTVNGYKSIKIFLKTSNKCRTTYTCRLVLVCCCDIHVNPCKNETSML